MALVQIYCSDGKQIFIESHFVLNSVYLYRKTGEDNIITHLAVRAHILEQIFYWYRIYCNDPPVPEIGYIPILDSIFFQINYNDLMEMAAVANRFSFRKFSEASDNFIALLIRGRTQEEIPKILNLSFQDAHSRSALPR